MKRFWRSKINRRLMKSAGRLAVFSLLLVSLANIDKVRPTNSALTDYENSAGNTMTAGYWAPPAITISSPASGEEWQVGSAHNIMWTATSADPSATAGMKIDLDYSCDGSVVWNTIIHNTGNDGTQSWTVPAVISDHCKIKVTATDSHSLTNSVESNDFEISWMVALNEFLPNPPGDDSVEHGPKPLCEYVELYNYGSEDIDVAGWYLYDAYDSHALPITTSNTDTGDTIVPSHGWLVVYQNDDADFSLNNSAAGDTVRLFDGVISSGHSIDFYTYSSTSSIAEGKTYARVPDGVGNWVDPVPTPGEKNTSSNDEKDFQKYYREVCFDKNGKSRCDLKFLKSIGLIDEKYQIVDTESVAAEAAPVESAAVETIKAEIVPVSSIDPIIPIEDEAAPAVDDASSDTEDPDNISPPPVEEPKVISKEFDITISGKLDVPDGFEVDADQKMKKIELMGEESAISELKDFEINLAEIKIDKAEEIEITVGDLDLPKDVELVGAKKDDVIAVITVTEKPKEEPKKDEKVSEKADAATPSKDEIEVEEKKDDSKDKTDGGGGNRDDSAPKDIDSVML